MYLLDKVCNSRLVRSEHDIVVREKHVSEIIREFINGLDIVVVTCSDGDKVSRECLIKAEECAKKKLKPRLNPLV